MNEWKCIDFKCVRKPTKSRLSLTRTPCKQIQPLSRIETIKVRIPCNQSGRKGKNLPKTSTRIAIVAFVWAICVYVFVCLSVCLSVWLFPLYRSHFKNNLHQISRTGRHQYGEEPIRFSRSRVKGQGHATTAMEISTSPLSYFLLNVRSEARILSWGFTNPLEVESNIGLISLRRLFSRR